MGVRLRYAFLAGATVAVAGCGFVHDQGIDGPYRLVAVDAIDQLRVCYEVEGDCVGRTPAPVSAYGVDDDWITVLVSGRYYVIDRKADGAFAEPEDAVSGPYSEQTFEDLATGRGLPEIATWVNDRHD